MDLNSRYKLCERDVAEREVSGSTLLVPVKEAAGIFELNEMSSRIWQEIKQHTVLQNACDVLVAEIEAVDDDSSIEQAADGDEAYSRAAFQEDVLLIASKLQEIGAIEIVQD